MDRETEKKLIISQQRTYKIFKGNEIIQKARYDLNITELKELSYITSMVKPTDDESTVYRFSLKDFCSVAGLDASNGHVIDQVKRSLKKLRDESFWFVNESGVHTLFSFIESPKIKLLIDFFIESDLILFGVMVSFSFLYPLFHNIFLLWLD